LYEQCTDDIQLQLHISFIFTSAQPHEREAIVNTNIQVYIKCKKKQVQNIKRA